MTKQLDWENDTDILKRVFSTSELQHDNIPPKIAFLSGRFAAKEAVLKCLGTGMQDGISLTDIQVLQTPHGKPTIELSGEVKKLADELGINSWHISITHSETNSIAFVISEKYKASSSNQYFIQFTLIKIMLMLYYSICIEFLL